MTAIQRRTFMARASAIPAAAALGTSGLAAGVIDRDPYPPEMFEEQVGTEFAVVKDGRPAGALKLQSVDRLHFKPGPGFRKPFSLLFEAPPEFEMRQDVLSLAHPQIAAMRLVVTPIVTRDGSRILEATFG